MNIKQIDAILKLGWDVTRKAWNDEKYIKKASCSLIFDLVIVKDGSMSEYIPSDEDFKAQDWEIYKTQKMPLPTLT